MLDTIAETIVFSTWEIAFDPTRLASVLELQTSPWHTITRRYWCSMMLNSIESHCIILGEKDLQYRDWVNPTKNRWSKIRRTEASGQNIVGTRRERSMREDLLAIKTEHIQNACILDVAGDPEHKCIVRVATVPEEISQFVRSRFVLLFGTNRACNHLQHTETIRANSHISLNPKFKNNPL